MTDPPAPAINQRGRRDGAALADQADRPSLRARARGALAPGALKLELSNSKGSGGNDSSTPDDLANTLGSPMAPTAAGRGRTGSWPTAPSRAQRRHPDRQLDRWHFSRNPEGLEGHDDRRRHAGGRRQPHVPSSATSTATGASTRWTTTSSVVPSASRPVPTGLTTPSISAGSQVHQCPRLQPIPPQGRSCTRRSHLRERGREEKAKEP